MPGRRIPIKWPTTLLRVKEPAGLTYGQQVKKAALDAGIGKEKWIDWALLNAIEKPYYGNPYTAPLAVEIPYEFLKPLQRQQALYDGGYDKTTRPYQRAIEDEAEAVLNTMEGMGASFGRENLELKLLNHPDVQTERVASILAEAEPGTLPLTPYALRKDRDAGLGLAPLIYGNLKRIGGLYPQRFPHMDSAFATSAYKRIMDDINAANGTTYESPFGSVFEPWIKTFGPVTEAPVEPAHPELAEIPVVEASPELTGYAMQNEIPFMVDEVRPAPKIKAKKVPGAKKGSQRTIYYDIKDGGTETLSVDHELPVSEKTRSAAYSKAGRPGKKRRAEQYQEAYFGAGNVPEGFIDENGTEWLGGPPQLKHGGVTPFRRIK